MSRTDLHHICGTMAQDVGQSFQISVTHTTHSIYIIIPSTNILLGGDDVQPCTVDESPITKSDVTQLAQLRFLNIV